MADRRRGEGGGGKLGSGVDDVLKRPTNFQRAQSTPTRAYSQNN
jgi:hypothetical protein